MGLGEFLHEGLGFFVEGGVHAKADFDELVEDGGARLDKVLAFGQDDYAYGADVGEPSTLGDTSASGFVDEQELGLGFEGEDDRLTFSMIQLIAQQIYGDRILNGLDANPRG